MANDPRVLRFGAGTQVYNFPNYVQRFDPAIRLARASGIPLPGATGQYDPFGTGPFPDDAGTITVDLILRTSNGGVDMDSLRDDLLKLKGWGVQRLYYQPSDPDALERWIDCKVVDVPTPVRLAELDDIWHRIGVQFWVPYPRWFTIGTEAPQWGEVTWANFNWGGTATPDAVSGTSTDITVTTIGTAETYPRFVIELAAGQSAEDITIQRIVNAQVVDELAYDGTLTAGDALEINCRNKSITKNNVADYASLTEMRAEWFALQPGDNTVRVTMANAGDAASITIRYFEAYY